MEAMAKRQRDLKMDLNIAKSLLDDGLITKKAFREIQATAEEYQQRVAAFVRCRVRSEVHHNGTCDTLHRFH